MYAVPLVNMPAEGTYTAQDCNCLVVMQCTWTIETSAHLLMLNLLAVPLQSEDVASEWFKPKLRHCCREC